jgi:hypothetical protein
MDLEINIWIDFSKQLSPFVCVISIQLEKRIRLQLNRPASVSVKLVHVASVKVCSRSNLPARSITPSRNPLDVIGVTITSTYVL